MRLVGGLALAGLVVGLLVSSGDEPKASATASKPAVAAASPSAVLYTAYENARLSAFVPAGWRRDGNEGDVRWIAPGGDVAVRVDAALEYPAAGAVSSA